MIAGSSFSRLVRATPAVLAALLAFVLVPGCDESYSTDLEYPLRSDPLVVSRPTATVEHLDPPGQLDQLISSVNSKDGKALDPTNMKSVDRTAVQKALDGAFGTPAKPTVKIEDASADDLKSMGLDAGALEKGSILYRRHCLHCHGLTGDGRGPTASWVNPHPRDYRQGLFKFMSTQGKSNRPHREDLLRTIRQGIEGTSMPSFGLLAEEELNHLVAYVIHLSMRGNIEFLLMEQLLTAPPDDLDETISKRISSVWGWWQQSQRPESRVTPDAPPTYTGEQLQASIERGYKLFTEAKEGSASCISCHRDFGRVYDYRYDDWGTIVRPTDLTSGVYRGGRRPVDIYWRVAAGVVPSGMPKFGDALKSDKIWDLVNFVQALPYPAMLPEQTIRKEIYGPYALPDAKSKEHSSH